MFETVEALELLIEPGTRAHVTMTFDEYWLEVTTEYQGKPLVTSGAVPHHDELLADDSQLTRLSGVILRRLASRLSIDSSGGRQRIRLGFEH
jgi:hypothetical protein